jgi:copper(I)-binding protein
MIRLGASVALATLVAGTAVAQAPGPQAPSSQVVLRISGAWARPSMPERPMSAAYAVIENPGAQAVVLTAVRCDVTPRAEIHESFEENGMMRMRRIPELTVPAGGRVELRPGGHHIMLMMLPQPLVAGGRVTCDLLAGERVAGRLEAEVRAP